jgi:NAD(P)-dependent dehydrogenase (short-subunit alcohol dehydrogenase family)
LRALFVGGTSGIGLAAARLALEAGWDVVVAGRDPSRAEIDADKVVFDVTDEAGLRIALAGIEPVDHLVFSTVASATGRLCELDLAAARRAFDTKYWGPLAAIQAVEVRDSITLTSGVAASTPMVGGAITASINGAIESLVKTLAVELAPVRVNAVAPGVIVSPLWDRLREADRTAMFDRLSGTLPAGRVGTPEDVAAAILFVMRNGFVTGETVHVDGGHRLAQP